VLIAIGNSGDADLVESARKLLEDASPLVRAMAVWALSRLVPQDEFRALENRYRNAEPDSDVAAEWGVGQAYGDGVSGNRPNFPKHT